MNKKILVITDISRTLLLAERLGKQLYLDRRRELDNIKPNDKYENYSIIWRPGREYFLDSLMIKYRDRFDVAVWSSLDRDKTAAFAKSFFGKHFRNLLFVSTCNREQYEGTQKEYSTEPIKIERDISLINQKFPNYDLPNIVMVNVYPNLLEQHSCIQSLIMKLMILQYTSPLFLFTFIYIVIKSNPNYIIKLNHLINLFQIIYILIFIFLQANLKYLNLQLIQLKIVLNFFKEPDNQFYQNSDNKQTQKILQTVPKFDPQYVDVQTDGSLDLLVKYLNGLSMLINKQKIQDIRTAIRAKPIENMDKRMDNLRNKMHEYL